MTSPMDVSPGHTSATSPNIIAITDRSSRNAQLTASAASIGSLPLEFGMALKRDRDAVVDRSDARRRPRLALRFFLLRPRADGPLQNHLAALDFRLDVLRVELRCPHEGLFNSFLQLGRRRLRFDGDQV